MVRPLLDCLLGYSVACLTLSCSLSSVQAGILRSSSNPNPYLRVLIYFLYRLLTALAFPLYLLYLLRRGLRDRRYFQFLGERFGNAPLCWNATVPGGIWLHAVSVGEVVSAIEF